MGHTQSNFYIKSVPISGQFSQEKMRDTSLPEHDTTPKTFDDLSPYNTKVNFNQYVQKIDLASVWHHKINQKIRNNSEVQFIKIQNKNAKSPNLQQDSIIQQNNKILKMSETWKRDHYSNAIFKQYQSVKISPRIEPMIPVPNYEHLGNTLLNKND